MEARVVALAEVLGVDLALPLLVWPSTLSLRMAVALLQLHLRRQRDLELKLSPLYLKPDRLHSLLVRLQAKSPRLILNHSSKRLKRLFQGVWKERFLVDIQVAPRADLRRCLTASACVLFDQVLGQLGHVCIRRLLTRRSMLPEHQVHLVDLFVQPRSISELAEDLLVLELVDVR
jgi:hypothetical protein